jgi:DNA-binding winged helix-turn-helix (wHTH) protein
MPVRFGDCVFDPEARELWRGPQRVALSPKAFQLLALLIAHRPRPLSHASLRDALWPDASVGYTSLARVVTEVRKALGGDAGPASFVRTVPRFGYAFAGAASASASGPAEAAPAGAGRPCLVLAEREIALLDGENVIGRDEGLAVRIDSPGVSRRHARIVVHGEEASLEDLGSKNGTFVGEERLQAPRLLAHGDVISLGRHLRLTFARRGPRLTETDAP